MAKFKLSTEPHLGRMIVLDTETTGLSPKTGHKIVELAAVELIDGRLTGKSFHSYINPERDVPFEAVEVHGLTEAFLSDKPTFGQISDEFMDFVADASVKSWAHNAPFDGRFLSAELEAVGAASLSNLTCSLKLARQVLGKGKRDLATLAGMAGVEFSGRGAHSALADTEVLAGVLTKLLWPEEVKLALNPQAAPAKSAPQKPKAKAQQIKLPNGFVPLTGETDTRICRYDDLEIDHLITSRGKRWTAEEESQLANGFLQDGKDIIDLITAHGRTPAALFLKLEALGVVAEDHPYKRLR